MSPLSCQAGDSFHAGVQSFRGRTAYVGGHRAHADDSEVAIGKRWRAGYPSGQPVLLPGCLITPYGQKTRTRLDSSGYDSAIAHPAACMLPTSSCILNAK